MKRIIDIKLPRTGRIVRESKAGNYLVEWHFGSSGPKTQEWVSRNRIKRRRRSDILTYRSPSP